MSDPVRERFDIPLPNSKILRGTVYGTRHRPTGRRITVTPPGKPGVILFDSGDQYDLGNAQNVLDIWLAEIVGLIQAGYIASAIDDPPPQEEPPAPSIHDEPPVSSDPAENVETAELVIPPPMIDPTDSPELCSRDWLARS